MVVILSTHIGKLYRRLHHATRSISIAIHNSIRKRTMIGPNPHGPLETLTLLDKRGKSLFNLPKLLQIRTLIIFKDSKRGSFIDKIPWVNTHLVYIFCNK